MSFATATTTPRASWPAGLQDAYDVLASTFPTFPLHGGNIELDAGVVRITTSDPLSKLFREPAGNTITLPINGVPVDHAVVIVQTLWTLAYPVDVLPIR